jgi:NAD(P)-dependent dehydrogenase (short-subunit alcohol dehydrogenase family)
MNKKKIYVVTGAASGIGLALIKCLCREHTVFAGYRSENKKDMLQSISENIYPFYADYSKPETIKAAAEYIKSKTDKIDTLVNIAGCVVAGPVENLVINEVRRQFDVNVFGHIEMTQNLVELLHNGRIINVSSMASFGLFPFISPYCASKKCLDMFFNSFLIENKRNIKVISIKPGVICTPLWEKSIDENSKYNELRNGYEKEMDYVMKNAQKNETKGLGVNEVVEVILKADRVNNPKLSYTVGGDAFCAKIISKLPQSLINKIIKLGIKARIK